MPNIYKDTPNQYLSFYAYDPITGSGVSGAEGTFYMRVWFDDNTTSALTNPPSGLNQTYFPGQYVCPLTQAETNYDLFIVNPQSASGNIVTDTISVYTLDASTSGVGGGGGGATASEVADAVWDEAFSGHTTTNTFGEFLSRISISGVAVSGLVQTNYLIGLTALAQEYIDEGYVSASVSDVSLTPLNQIAQYVWRDIVSENQNTSGSFAELLARISGSGVNLSGWRGLQPLTLSNQRVRVSLEAINNDADAAAGLEAASIEYNDNSYFLASVAGFSNGVLDESAVDSTFTSMVAGAVWDEVQHGHQTVNTFGELVGRIAVSGIDVSGWRGLQPGPLVGASGLVQAHIVDINSGVSISSISSNDLANIADRVWDEMLNEHRDVGSAGAFLRTRSFDGWSQ